MKIQKAGYEILTPISEGGVKELQHIERIGRVCYKSEDKITEEYGDPWESSRQDFDKMFFFIVYIPLCLYFNRERQRFTSIRFICLHSIMSLF